ncbi:MAG: ribonuclease III, partial [Erysipelotrichaceae bacterium]|nr:ribonuclease III [Erysipelotrichaceae bacterium]
FEETTSTVVDYKTRLQEYVQTDSRKTIEYEILSVTGPSNNPVFEIAVKVDGLVFGVGKGSSKKEAQKMAAKDALEKVAG